MSWSRTKSRALEVVAPGPLELEDFVELMKAVRDEDVPLIVAQIQAGRAPASDQPRRPR